MQALNGTPQPFSLSFTQLWHSGVSNEVAHDPSSHATAQGPLHTQETSELNRFTDSAQSSDDSPDINFAQPVHGVVGMGVPLVVEEAGPQVRSLADLFSTS